MNDKLQQRARELADEIIAERLSYKRALLERAILAALSEQQEAQDVDRLNRAYAERNALAVAFVKAAIAAGWKAGRGYDNSPEKGWDPEWRHVVYVDLPNGQQVSWHMSPDQVPLLHGLPDYAGRWDGLFLARSPDWPALINAQAKPAEQGQRPVFRERPAHFVYRNSSIPQPCHCWADDDHLVGEEVLHYTAPQPAVPEGWVLVPVRLTAAMRDAAEGSLMGWPATVWNRAWAAMLAAKPEAQG